MANPKDFKYDNKTIAIPAARCCDGDAGTWYGSLWQ
jgi:hypothetical protein